MSVTPVTGDNVSVIAPSPSDSGVDPTAQPTPGYRAGIIGGGFMGTVHARAIRVSGGTVTVAAAGDPENSRLAQEAVGAPIRFDDPQGLIDCDECNVVHVCTPNVFHAPIALAALRAGKHVVCEKPLATTVADAEALANAARDSGLVGVVPFVYRFHPMVREAREMVRTGGLGRISLAHGSYLQDWLAGVDDDNWRVDDALGGPTRAFGDIGSHWCDLMEFVTGERITTLNAQLVTVNRERGAGTRHAVRTEDIATVQFATDGGVVGTVTLSQVSPGRKNRLLLEVSGSEGTITFDQERAEELWNGRRDASRALVRDPQTLSPAAARYARVPAGHPQGYQDCFDHFIADTAAAIRGEAPDGLPTFDDGLRAARIADAVLRSAAERAWVEVPT